MMKNKIKLFLKKYNHKTKYLEQDLLYIDCVKNSSISFGILFPTYGSIFYIRNSIQFNFYSYKKRNKVIIEYNHV